MKNIHLCITLLISILAFSQQEKDRAFYFDSINNSATKENFHHYIVIKDYDTPQTKYQYSFFDKTNRIFQEGFTSDKFSIKNVDEIKYYYDNGKLKELITYNSSSNPAGKFAKWYENGQMEIEGENLSNIESTKLISKEKIINAWTKNGKQTVINGNGNYMLSIKDSYNGNYIEKGTIKDGFKNGTWEGTQSFSDSKSILTYTEKYVDGNLIEGCSYDSEMNPYIYDTVFEVASPPGGLKNFLTYIAKNYKTETISDYIDKDLIGTIYIQFIIEKDGSMNDYKVIRDLGFGTAAEAIRMLKSAPKFNPARSRGKIIKSKYTLPIKLTIRVE